MVRFITATKSGGIALCDDEGGKTRLLRSFVKEGVAADAADDQFQLMVREKDVVVAYIGGGGDSLVVASYAAKTTDFSKAEHEVKVVFNGEENLKSLHFSPKGTYLALIAKYDKAVHTGKDGVASQNARCVRVDDLLAIGGDSAKAAAAVDICGGGCVIKIPALWPCWRWTCDEQLCCKAFVAGVNVHEAHPGGAFKKLEAKGIGGFALSNTSEADDGMSFQSHFISVFIPEVKGAAAKCLVYALDGSDMKQPVNQKAFYNASSCTFYWSPAGCKNPPAVLVLSHTENDKSGAAYAGLTHAFFVSTANQASSTLGPVHAVAWRPGAGRKSQYLVCHGESKDDTANAVVMYSGGPKGEKLMTFGKVRRNTVVFSPDGAAFCVAGLGNLAGDLDFWALEVGKEKESKQVGHQKYVGCVSLEYAGSGEGTRVLCASTAPRMRVDNGYKLFDAAGGE